MKILIIRTGAILVAAAFIVAGCSKTEKSAAPATSVSPSTWSLEKSAASAQLKQFIAAKEAQAKKFAAQDGAAVPPPEFAPFFAAAEKGDWRTATNLFETMIGKVRKDTNPRRTWWQPTIEAYGVYEFFPTGDEKYTIAFGRDIVKSIPEGSIYFGGTDPGRFLVAASMESQVDAKPFFELTQNALVDPTYLDYLRSMYGDRILIPSQKDSQKCFTDYVVDLQQRQLNQKLLPGEEAHADAEGHVQVNGHIAVMGINALLAKVIFDKNTNRDFYLEESFPLSWMYPYLEPHGLIMKINRQPLAEISADAIEADHVYWTKYVTPMIGDWLNDDTTVKDVADFVEKFYVKRDLSGFKGDPNYLQSQDAQKAFSKLRGSIGGLYSWRCGFGVPGQTAPDQYLPRSDAGKDRMKREADFAFKQAVALCPSSPEAVFGYLAFLMNENRKSDAALVMETATHVDPTNATFKQALAGIPR